MWSFRDRELLNRISKANTRAGKTINALLENPGGHPDPAALREMGHRYRTLGDALIERADEISEKTVVVIER